MADDFVNDLLMQVENLNSSVQSKDETIAELQEENKQLNQQRITMEIELNELKKALDQETKKTKDLQSQLE